LALRQQAQEPVTSQWIEFAEDVVEQEQRIDAAALLDKLVPAKTKGEGQRSLLPLRGLAAGVAPVKCQRNVIALWSYRRVAAMAVVVERGL
jgi:hypothetical protein